ncbi:MAG: CRTAC1 family protein [bacterium]
MKKCVCLLGLMCGVLGGGGEARAQVTELSYDDGTPSGSVMLSPGDIEVVRFAVEHPATVLTLRLHFGVASGDATVMIWADNGGNAPDPDTVLWSGVVTPVAGEWTEIDVSGEGLELPALQNFYVGQLVGDASTLLSWDSSGADETHSLVRIDGEWYFVGDGGDPARAVDALVRAVVEYHDVAESHWFTDVTEDLSSDVGLSRMAWADYDNDGDEDLLVNGNRLFSNNGDGTFTEVSEQAGIAGKPTNGGIWADYDNDGHLDFYATVHNFLPLCSVPADCAADGYTCTAGRCAAEGSTDPPAHDILWRANGDGTFTDVSETAGQVYDFLPTEGAAWGDLDGDGYVDLYVANYETPTSWTGGALSVGTEDYLWQNNGDGTFTDISVESGIRGLSARCGRGVNWADYDDDGWLDIFVSNYRLNFNFLWHNNGNGTFENKSGDAGVAGEVLQGAWGHTIGSQWGDFDNDGDWDLFTANLAHPRFIEFSDKSMLYINGGAPDYTFTDIREAAGITYYETHSDTALGDFDNDGFLDLFVTGVYVGYRSFLYRSNGDLTFTDETYNAGVFVDNGWGAAWADFDNDGDLDLVSQGHLYRNDLDAGNWMKIRLVGVQSNRAAIGARVLVTAGDQTFMRQVEGGKGTTTQNALTLHFGLGAATAADEIRILWPTWPPWTETYQAVQAGRTVTYIEGYGEQTDGGVTGDGGASADGGTEPPDDGGGCGCRTSSADRAAPPLIGVLLLLMMMLRRRGRERR